MTEPDRVAEAFAALRAGPRLPITPPGAAAVASTLRRRRAIRAGIAAAVAIAVLGLTPLLASGSTDRRQPTDLPTATPTPAPTTSSTVNASRTGAPSGGSGPVNRGPCAKDGVAELVDQSGQTVTVAFHAAPAVSPSPTAAPTESPTASPEPTASPTATPDPATLPPCASVTVAVFWASYVLVAGELTLNHHGEVPVGARPRTLTVEPEPCEHWFVFHTVTPPQTIPADSGDPFWDERHKVSALLAQGVADCGTASPTPSPTG